MRATHLLNPVALNSNGGIKYHRSLIQRDNYWFLYRGPVCGIAARQGFLLSCPVSGVILSTNTGRIVWERKSNLVSDQSRPLAFGNSPFVVDPLAITPFCYGDL